ncbi:MAG: type I restriction enzyme HsdR N-terminal domain-containing protein [Phycisphaerae bacterium]|nr:type I restriction enzyme HsdR N-terminal domain-containing protein [Phycisphaerae bacterium]NUQ47427.1 type I restriction enzyme HsdR N-terminal domain-containing protein [Phycisphaerae bacterium]
MAIPKRVAERIVSSLKSFRNILEQQKARDVSEADTVTVVKDLLSEIFGYDKYAEVTSEHFIRGTYCDLAVKLDTKLAFLIEVKAIGLDLKDSHIKQAVDYAANQGCEWVVLTNAVEWCLYHIVFKKPIDRQEIARFNLLQVSAKNEGDLEKLYLVTREGFAKSALAEYRDRKDATSRFMLAAIILNTDSVQSAIRREIRRVSDILVKPEVIDKMLREEVIKRETIEGEQAELATRRVSRSAERSIPKGKDVEDESVPAPVQPTSMTIAAAGL